MSGYVYILSNDAYFRTDAGKHLPLLKIGKSSRHPSERLEELFTTGVPGRFVLQYYAKCVDHDRAERRLHTLLAAYRYDRGREFFAIETAHAIASIQQHLASLIVEDVVLYRFPEEIHALLEFEAREQAAIVAQREYEKERHAWVQAKNTERDASIETEAKLRGGQSSLPTAVGVGLSVLVIPLFFVLGPWALAGWYGAYQVSKYLESEAVERERIALRAARRRFVEDDYHIVNPSPALRAAIERDRNQWEIRRSQTARQVRSGWNSTAEDVPRRNNDRRPSYAPVGSTFLCPNCGKPMRVRGTGRLRVRCPRCSTSWEGTFEGT